MGSIVPIILLNLEEKGNIGQHRVYFTAYPAQHRVDRARKWLYLTASSPDKGTYTGVKGKGQDLHGVQNCAKPCKNGEIVYNRGRKAR